MGYLKLIFGGITPSVNRGYTKLSIALLEESMFQRFQDIYNTKCQFFSRV